MSFGGLVLTNNGRNKMAAAISEKNALKFTHIQLGDGTFNGSYSSKSELSHMVMEIPVTRVQRNNNEVLIECDWSSKQVPTAFYLREIGIIGNEVLCYYDNARNGDAEYIDPGSEEVVKQKRFRFTISVTDDVEITTMLSSGLYALAEDVEESLSDLNKNKLDKTGDASGVTVTFTEAKKRENISSGEKLSTLFGKIGKFFSDLKTVAFSGSYTDLIDKPTAKDIGAVSTVASQGLSDAEKANARENIGAFSSSEGSELKKSVSDGKSAVASAITAMGQSTSSDATYQIMADNVKKIAPELSQDGQKVSATVNGNNKRDLTVSAGELNTPSMLWEGATLTSKSTINTAGYLAASAEKSATVNLTTKAATTVTPGTKEQTAVSSGSRLYFSGDLKVASLGGDAGADNVLTGKKFSSDSAGRAVSGTMANNGAVSKELSAGGSYTVPKGYHNGSGKVTAKSLASQTGVDSGKTAAGASQILTGYQAWVNGSKVTGTMVNNGAKNTYAPTGGDTKVIEKGYHDGNGRIYSRIIFADSCGSPQDVVLGNGNSGYYLGDELKIDDGLKYRQIRGAADNISGMLWKKPIYTQYADKVMFIFNISKYNGAANYGYAKFVIFDPSAFFGLCNNTGVISAVKITASNNAKLANAGGQVTGQVVKISLSHSGMTGVSMPDIVNCGIIAYGGFCVDLLAILVL